MTKVKTRIVLAESPYRGSTAADDESSFCGSTAALKKMPMPVERIAQVFKALGDPTRVTLLSLIAQSPDGEACICELTGPVNLSQPTVSHHMKRLADAGLVMREQRGKWAYFQIAATTGDDLKRALGFVLPPTRCELTDTN